MSINTPQRLKTPLLSLPANGCLNVHFGMLPKYRGLLPIFHALMNGEPSFGVTVHLMDEKLDNGDIVCPTGDTDRGIRYAGLAVPKGFAAASELLAEAIDACGRGSLVRRPNVEAEKTYYSYPTPERIKAYRRRVRESLAR